MLVSKTKISKNYERTQRNINYSSLTNYMQKLNNNTCKNYKWIKKKYEVLIYIKINDKRISIIKNILRNFQKLKYS